MKKDIIALCFQISLISKLEVISQLLHIDESKSENEGEGEDKDKDEWETLDSESEESEDSSFELL